MTATVKVGTAAYTIVASPSQDSRGNWTCPTYTINGQTYNFPQDTKQATPTYETCAKAELACQREAQRVIAGIQ